MYIQTARSAVLFTYNNIDRHELQPITPTRLDTKHMYATYNTHTDTADGDQTNIIIVLFSVNPWFIYWSLPVFQCQKTDHIIGWTHKIEGRGRILLEYSSRKLLRCIHMYSTIHSTCKKIERKSVQSTWCMAYPCLLPGKKKTVQIKGYIAEPGKIENRPN